jgi:hypothetical protein
MGTKAILAVLADYQDRMTDSLATEISAAQRVTDERNLRLCDDARAELEAIRKAARAWAESDHGELPEELGDLMESIAKEGP